MAVRTNLCKNPQPSHAAGSLPGQWTAVDVTNSTVVYSDGGVYDGITSKHIKITGGAGCNNSAGVRVKTAVNGELTPGEYITVSAVLGEAALTGCTLEFVLLFYTDATAYVNRYDGAISPGIGFARASCSTIVPATATKVFVDLRANADFSQEDVQEYSICQVLIEKAAAAGDYFDGSSVKAGFVYAWTGTPHASTSTEMPVKHPIFGGTIIR